MRCVLMSLIDVHSTPKTGQFSVNVNSLDVSLAVPFKGKDVENGAIVRNVECMNRMIYCGLFASSQVTLLLRSSRRVCAAAITAPEMSSTASGL